MDGWKYMYRQAGRKRKRFEKQQISKIAIFQKRANGWNSWKTVIQSENKLSAKTSCLLCEMEWKQTKSKERNRAVIFAENLIIRLSGAFNAFARLSAIIYLQCNENKIISTIIQCVMKRKHMLAFSPSRVNKTNAFTVLVAVTCITSKNILAVIVDCDYHDSSSAAAPAGCRTGGDDYYKQRLLFNTVPNLEKRTQSLQFFTGRQSRRIISCVCRDGCWMWSFSACLHPETGEQADNLIIIPFLEVDYISLPYTDHLNWYWKGIITFLARCIHYGYW